MRSSSSRDFKHLEWIISYILLGNNGDSQVYIQMQFLLHLSIYIYIYI